MVRIRPYRLDDHSAVWEAARESMAELQPWMPWCHPDYSPEESRSWLEAQVAAFARRDVFEFAITSDDDRYLGACGLNQIDRPNQRANLGYWVRSAATRRGVATAAVGLLRDWGFRIWRLGDLVRGREELRGVVTSGAEMLVARR